MTTRGRAIPITVPPGIYRQGTDYESQGRWRDCDNIRFFQDRVTPRGGKTETGLTDLNERVCGAHSWLDNTGLPTLAVGTTTGLKVTQSQLSGTFSDITPVGFQNGREDSALQYGYGIGLYGQEEYGDERTEDGNTGGNVSAAQVWALNNRGQDLVASAVSDGKIYTWTPPDAGVKAAQLANSPEQVTWSVVTPLQHVMALGADGDPRKIAWSDNVDPTIWAPDATNQAGFLQLQGSSVPVGAVTYRKSVLVWTRDSVIELRQAPYPFWWSQVEVRNAGGGVSPRAAVTDGNIVAWMGFRNFWVYDGSIARPLRCDVLDYVYSQINSVQLAKVCTAHLPEYSEFVWYYPADTKDNTRFVVWNYQENHWSIGSSEVETYLPRSVFDENLSWDVDGATYAEETATPNDAPYIESSAIDISDGYELIHLHAFIPDWQTGDARPRTLASTKWMIYGKNTPQDEYELLTETQMFLRREPIKSVALRGRARQIKVRFQAGKNLTWELGKMRVLVSTGGRRT